MGEDTAARIGDGIALVASSLLIVYLFSVVAVFTLQNPSKSLMGNFGTALVFGKVEDQG